MSKFIKLTILGNGIGAYFNPRLITQINEDGVAARIFVAGDGPDTQGVLVAQSPSAILAAIAEAAGAPADVTSVTDEMVEAGIDCWRHSSGTMVECFRKALEAALALRARRQS